MATVPTVPTARICVRAPACDVRVVCVHRARRARVISSIIFFII